jgi:hypothetical protein
MQWYAETVQRRTRQITGDLLVAAWVVGWVLVGRWVFGLVRTLAAPADPLREAGTAWRDRMLDVAERVVEVPLVGDTLDDPFTGASSAGTDLINAGNGLEDAVTRLAWLLSLVTAGVPILSVVGVYVALRVLGARRAASVGRGRDTAAAQELLALRALVHQSPATLARVATDPLQAWRDGDPQTVATLASLELRRVGLRARPVAAE